MAEGSTSYGQVLKSTTITAGAAVLGAMISLVSSKASAVLLGTAGVGEIRLYQSLAGPLGALVGAGMGPGAVGAMARAHAGSDFLRYRATFTALVRLSLVMGAAGWLLLFVLAGPASSVLFDGEISAEEISWFGVTILLGSVTSALLSRLQALRQVLVLAKYGLVSASLSTVAAIASYWIWGREGVLPSLIAAGVLQLVGAWWFSRDGLVASRDDRPVPRQGWKETIAIGRELAVAGVPFMVGALMPGISLAIIGGITVRVIGIDGNGLFSAAWSLSILFANFINSALWPDFFPRISAASHDAQLVNRYTNEQIEAGLLLGTPGLVAMIVFAPVAIDLLFAPAFLAAADLVVLFSCGIVVQISQWPVGYLVLAKGRSGMNIALQVLGVALTFPMFWLGSTTLGVLGLGVGYLAVVLLIDLFTFIVVNPGIGFALSPEARRIKVAAWTLCAVAVATTRLDSPYEGLAGLSLVALASAVSLRGLVHRLGDEHRVVRVIHGVPVLRVLAAIARFSGRGPGATGSP